MTVNAMAGSDSNEMDSGFGIYRRLYRSQARVIDGVSGSKIGASRYESLCSFRWLQVPKTVEWESESALTFYPSGRSTFALDDGPHLAAKLLLGLPQVIVDLHAVPELR